MTTRLLHLAAVTLLATLALQTPPAEAIDSASLPSSIRLANARALIEAKDWKGAIAELQGVNAPNDPDWNNLMGFSHRKAKKPDYVAAERFYDAALRIEPSHRGALSYSGELYLMQPGEGRAAPHHAEAGVQQRLPRTGPAGPGDRALQGRRQQVRAGARGACANQRARCTMSG